MGNVVGIGIARTLVDPDGDSIIDASANALKVKLVDSAAINIGDVVLTDSSDNAVSVTSASSKTNPDLDGTYLLGTHALLSARSSPTTTVGLNAEVGTYNSLCVAISDGGQVASVDAANRLEIAFPHVEVAHGDVVGSVPGIFLMGETKANDGSYFPNNVTEGKGARIACSLYGAMYVALTTDDGTDTMSWRDQATCSGSPGVITVGGTYRASPTTYDTTDAAVLQVDVNGNLKTVHSITGIAQGTVTIGGTALQLDGGTDGYDIACKRVDLFSRPTNDGIIYIGSANTVAGNGATGGIGLEGGDFYSFDINNLTHIWAEASEADQELNFIYYT